MKDLELIKRVGKTSYEALMSAKSLVKPGVKLLDVANAAEKLLFDNGYTCAFPLNLSVNGEAAHYSPAVADDKVFGEKDIVKVDFGAAKDGILGDCAVTVDLSGENGKLVEATEQALADAIAVVRTGVKVNAIGKVIANAIESRGFMPVENLGGHGVGEHDLHSKVFIPNFDNGDEAALEENDVIAIEPFATSGKKGLVTDSDICEIYGFVGPALVRNPDARRVLDEIMSKYNSEPFAVRWLSNVVPDKFKLYVAVKELWRSGALEPYPMLIGLGGGNISQAEAELLVTKDGCEVLTK